MRAMELSTLLSAIRRTAITIAVATTLLLSGLSVPARAEGRTFAVGCWAFNFSQVGRFFPNPVNRTTQGQIKTRINLLVFGTDQMLYPATVSTTVTNLAGQTVWNGSGVYNSSPDQEIVAATVSNIAAGTYIVRVSAASGICSGNPSFSSRVIVV